MLLWHYFKCLYNSCNCCEFFLNIRIILAIVFVFIDLLFGTVAMSYWASKTIYGTWCFEKRDFYWFFSSNILLQQTTATIVVAGSGFRVGFCMAAVKWHSNFVCDDYKTCTLHSYTYKRVLYICIPVIEWNWHQATLTNIQTYICMWM